MSSGFVKVFVEGFGCSANMAEAEQIKGFLKSNSVAVLPAPGRADWIIIHSCGVKQATEFKLLKRIRELKQQNPLSPILVSGCLPQINPAILSNEPQVVLAGTELESIAKILGLPFQSFSPLLPREPSNPFVSVIPISKGCLSHCTFCGTKTAKGKLKSFSVESIATRFESDWKRGTKEFWLASQDNGCYGFDCSTNLPALVQKLLSFPGDFRVRIGMLSPQYLFQYLDSFIELFSDARVYQFVHLPVQSGNNRILKLMRRLYSAEEFESLVAELRKKIPGLSLSTDIIVGFPTETWEEFLDSVHLVERIHPDIVNISRFALRPGTSSACLPQWVDREKTNRSHFLSRVVRNLSLEKNKGLIGSVQTVLVSEKAKVNGFVGRTDSYKPVVLPEAVLGEFQTARVLEAFPFFVKGVLEKEPLRFPNPL